ncbi:hypothetical protein ABZ851_25870 [Streptomyces sp. NPDC047049]|uniref:hypothetical protein n=1 Tax=Streptomyces sp. NPDC047049 TaxID=3156688 RepID=UPI0034044069
MQLVEWERNFKTWNYSFSYSQLLLRSAPRHEGDTRVDVLFSNVRHMSIAAKMERLKIEQEDFEGARERLGITASPIEPFELFVLNQGAGYVLATHCQWHEDNEWIDAPSHFGPFRQVR